MSNIINKQIKVTDKIIGSSSIDLTVGGSSRLYITGAGDVGIGTTVPGKLLDVNGDLNFNGDIYQNGSLFSGSSQWGSAGSNIYFNTGNVGLGTTDPQSKLDIRSGDIYFLNNDSVSFNQIYFSDESLASDYFSIAVPVNSTLTTAKVSIGTFHSDGIDFYTENGNLHLLRNGNVGIGTNIPEAKLHLFNDASTEYILLSGKATVSTDSTGIHFQLDDTLPSSRIKTKILAVGDGSWGQTDLHFCLNNTNDSSNAVVGTDTKMIITKSGTVGIGTTVPSELLHVEGNSVVTGDLNVDSNSLFVNSSTGKVGVSTSSPQELLEVYSGSRNTSYLIFKGLADISAPTDNVGIFFRNDGELTGTNRIKTKILAVGDGDWGRSDLHFCMNNVGDTSNAVVGTDTRVIFKRDGTVGIGITEPVTKLHIKQSNTDTDGGDLTGINQSALVLEKSTGTNSWSMSVINNNDLGFYYGTTSSGATSIKGYITTGSVNQMNFTGQHRCFLDTQDQIDKLIGMIVSANCNEYMNMSNGLSRGLGSVVSIDESLPIVKVTTTEKDKSVFGVISSLENPDLRTEHYGAFVTKFDKEPGDTRVYINSVGEGAIWVVNINGPLQSGDYICSSSLPGYGQKQDDDVVHNYTVAKITQDCDFSNLQIVSKRIKKAPLSGGGVINELDSSTGNLIWEPNVGEDGELVLEDKYTLKYLDINLNEINYSEYLNLISNGSAAYIAAFVGCTYHCG